MTDAPNPRIAFRHALPAAWSLTNGAKVMLLVFLFIAFFPSQILPGFFMTMNDGHEPTYLQEFITSASSLVVAAFALLGITNVTFARINGTPARFSMLWEGAGRHFAAMSLFVLILMATSRLLTYLTFSVELELLASLLLAIAGTAVVFTPYYVVGQGMNVAQAIVASLNTAFRNKGSLLLLLLLSSLGLSLTVIAPLVLIGWSAPLALLSIIGIIAWFVPFLVLLPGAMYTQAHPTTPAITPTVKLATTETVS